MPNTPIKHNRQTVLNYIIRYKKNNDGNSPTIREIMYACSIASTSNTSYILRDLQASGKVIILPRSRGIKVTGGKWTYSTGDTSCQS